jgi:hypothetical protein
MKQKLPLIVGAVIVLLLIVGGGVLAYKKMQTKKVTKAPVEQPKKKKFGDAFGGPINVIPQSDRPYVVISPTVVKEGQGVKVTIEEVKKPATTAEYELEYQTETNLEGATDTLKLDTLPAEKEYYLGTCSAGGACRAHTNVSGGSLLLRFSGTESYGVKQFWNYIENKTRQTSFTSKENTEDSSAPVTHGFILDSKDMSTQKIVVIYNTPGYPKTVTGTVVSEAYTLSASNPLKGKGTVSIQIKDDTATKVAIMGWDGQAWKEFPATVSNKFAKGEVELLSTYVAVKK